MIRNKLSIGRGFACLAAVACALTATGAGPKKVAHNLTFEDVNPRSATHGKTVELKGVYTGRGAVLQFIASWCKPCREDLPHLQALAEAGRVPVVLVASDEGPAGIENILIVAERAELTVPILFVPPDSVREVEQHWRHDVLPATYFLDAKGRICATRQGGLSLSALEAESAAIVSPAPG